MQKQIKNLITDALTSLQDAGNIPQDLDKENLIQLSRPREQSHGDFASNISLILAKKLRKNPLDIAQAIADAIPKCSLVEQIVVAKPGFINFYLTKQILHNIIGDILNTGEQYGRSDIGANKNVIVEFASVNPTGPLHVGHGRGITFGATCSDLLEAVGFNVHREYYVNDAGRQMDILATSTWMRYLELNNKDLHFPEAGYKGDYIVETARRLQVEFKESLRRSIDELTHDLPADEKDGGNKDFYMDALINRAKNLLGDVDYNTVLKRTLDPILADIRQDLEEFGVVFQQWFSELRLVNDGTVEKTIQMIDDLGLLYKKDGATWFKSSQFGDEKDRVVIRENGTRTYFASDIGYHFNKYQRGFDMIIDVLGADHHGYAPRIRALLRALDLDETKFKVLLVQFATLWRGKTRVKMTTRGGRYVTFRELRNEVGNDAARFFYVMRKNDQHVDFDLELAKSTSLDNPVHYIQYAHARICSVMREANDKDMEWNKEVGFKHLDLLSAPSEQSLIKLLQRYSEVVKKAALNFEPHLLAHYLRELAMCFHSYYNAEKFLIDDALLCNARLCLINSTRQVLANGLQLLGVKAPEEM